MVLTASTMLPLGAPAPDFKLPATDGGMIGLEDFSSEKLLCVLFICNHCPYVIHIAPALTRLAFDYGGQGVGFVAINSNDARAYPADDFDAMAAEKARREYPFPYLFDETQAVAKAYRAACTPDIFVFDSHRKLAYRGQFDDTRPRRIASGHYDSNESPATGADLAAALDALLEGRNPPEPQVPSMGCNIKWRAGNQPEYFS